MHWAAKRGHKDIVTLLLDNGADKTITTEKGESPLSLATRAEVRQLLGGEPGVTIDTSESNLPITPSYLKNPPLTSKVDISGVNVVSRRRQSHHNSTSVDNTNNINTQGHGNNSVQTSNATSEGKFMFIV